LIKNDNEFGKVSTRPEPKLIDFSSVETTYIMISTILDDFKLMNLADYSGKVLIDVQGYTRDGNDFGKKKLWQPDPDIFANIFCLKGTEQELENVSKEYIKKQKQKILLITKGVRGCEAFVFGERYMIKPEQVVQTENTIGAGDTFFAYFVVQFIKTEDARASLKYATRKTSEFLLEQNNHHHNGS